MQLLSKDPEQRIPNATVLLRRLEAMDRTLSLAMPAAATESQRGGETDPPAPPAAGPPAEAAAQGVAPPPAPLPPTLITENVPPLDSAIIPPLLAGGGPPDAMATAAFEKPATSAAMETLKPSGRFTPVGEEDLDQPELPAATPYPSLQVWILVGFLVAIGLTLRWFLQPPTADALYERIDARVSGGSSESLHEAQEDIDMFLSRFSGDPRCKRLRVYQEEIELDNLQRKFDRRAKGLGTASSLLPVEQAYVEALVYARDDPERGMAKLRALIDLFDDGKNRASSDPVGQCLKLARRQLARLQEQFDASSSEQLDEAVRRLDDADRIAGANPERAEGVYRAVVELYGHRPWAAEAVRRARAALDRLGKTSPPAAKAGKL